MPAFFTKNRKSPYPSFLLIPFSIAIFIFLWIILKTIFGIGDLTLPKPASVAADIWQLIWNKEILKDVAISLFRVATGFAAAAIVGIPVGIMCGIHKPIQNIFEPYFNFLRFIPAAAMIPLLILWFGVGEFGKIALIFIRALPYLVLYISSAAANVEKEYIEMGKVLGANQKQILTKIVFPRIFPQIWDICRIELGSSWSTVVLAEVLGANSGIGYRLVLAQRYVHITEIFSLVVISAAVALTIDSLLKFAYGKLFPWAEKSKILEL